MSRVIKKINVLLDEETYRAFTTIASLEGESPTKILLPVIEKYIRDRQKSAMNAFAGSLSKFNSSEVPKEESNKVANTIDSATMETEEHFKVYAQVAEEHPEFVVVDEVGERYLMQSKELKQALKIANLPVIPVTKVGVQPVINGAKSTKKLFKLR